jgi:predicted nucleotidyltransferase
MNGIEKTKNTIKEEVIDITKLPSHKIRNIYVYGSRVYNTHTINSDYDIIVTACSTYLNHEIYENNYNIHITTPDAFEDQLRHYDIHCLECIYAPDNAKIYILKDYPTNMPINLVQMKKMILSQSLWAWEKAKRRIKDGDIIGGSKSLFHSIRILMFGIQMTRYNSIIDFSEANYIWEELRTSEALEWQEYDKIWFPIRKNLITEIKILK